MVKILTACEKRQLEVHPHGYRNAQRLTSLILLLRYSGMRISDAVALSSDRLKGNKLFLYTAKTGTAVYTVLPDSIVKALEATPRVTTKLYFWTSQGKLTTAVKDWQRRLREIFNLAGVEKGDANAVAHRFRDTFSVELLVKRAWASDPLIIAGTKQVQIQ